MWVRIARRGRTRSIQASVFAKMAMRRMRFAPHAVDDPKLDPGERGERGLVEFGHIGRISDRPDAKAEAHAE